MNKIILYPFFCSIIFFISIVQMYAQPNLPSEQVEVIKDFDARIDKAKIIILQPIIPAKDTTQKMVHTYSLSPSNLEIVYNPPRIKPLAIPQEKQPDYFPLFLKAGYGTPNSPYASGSYHWFNAENIDLHVHGLYHSANKKSVAHQRFKEIKGGFSTRYVSNFGAAIKGGLTYRADNKYLYGYDHEVNAFTDSLASRNVTQLGLNLGVHNVFRTESDINYNAGIRYNNLDDAKGNKESEIELHLGMNKSLSDNQNVGIDIDALFITPKDTMIDNLTNYQIRPYFNFAAGLFKIKAGVNAAKNDKFKFYPNVNIQANISPGRLIAFIGWDGGLKSNSFSSLYEVNPYIAPNRTALTSTEYHEIYGGAKGAYKIFDYEVKLGYEIIDNLPIYLSNEADSRYFDAIYANGNIFRISGNIGAEVVKGIEFNAGLLSNTYSLEDHDKAWQLPAFTLSLGATVKSMQDKLRATINLTSENGVPVINELGEQDRLNPLIDLSIGADYMVTKNIGAFGQINNIFNNKRERWLQYPTYGINFKGGVIIRF